MKTALITGGSRGIGRESAITLARQDHAVVINYAGSAEDADNTVREIESFGGKAISVRADVASSEQVQNLFKEIGRATSELQSLMRISYAVFCLKKKKTKKKKIHNKLRNSI